MRVVRDYFGTLENKQIHSFTITNDNGVELSCINYGCIITKIIVPDRMGNYENIVLGYDTLEEYIKDTCFLGAVVGRVAGRIKGGSFSLDGKTYSLFKNENKNHLHGGMKGFNQVVWKASVFEGREEAGIQFFYLSPDGEEGYPGNVKINVTYALNNQNELIVRYAGESDQKTLLNVTNHSYFNLSGNLKRDVLDHTLRLKSNSFLEINSELLSTGKILEVDDTPFDFRNGRKIRSGATSQHSQNILAGNGYDHPFLLYTHNDQEILLKDQESGRTLTVETEEPGVVVYSGNNLPSAGQTRGVLLRKHLGICLETQGLPDAIHHPHLPSWVLEKGKAYASCSRYRFGVDEKNNFQP
ncbi:aldose epimerase family protein [Neobacillus novalis]|uniref:Aldose 1-epimerase n=1 Tax=Neobacillus novalis TaxID=220687 RepID=A0AA95SCC9_9BACI|nr:aldose epimerase family protein [Neobacillus novalis]WHY86023.1 aldose epimerase family protein [Neobacillus novalis]